jgi:hypothetical protein
VRSASLLCCLLAATAAGAADKDVQVATRRVFRLEWRDLDRMVRGRNIDIALPSAIRLKGTVTSIEDDALTLDVRKTSNKRAYPKGRAVVPRPEVTEFILHRREGHTWSAIGTGIGGTLGTLLGIGFIQALEGGRFRTTAVALSIALPTALGYGIGWAADHEDVSVIVVP